MMGLYGKLGTKALVYLFSSFTHYFSGNVERSVKIFEEMEKPDFITIEVFNNLLNILTEYVLEVKAKKKKKVESNRTNLLGIRSTLKH